MSMIGMLRGEIARKMDSYIVLDVAGVGYKVFVPPEVILSDTTTCTLFTYLAVRETALDLYGFLHQDDVDFFQELLGVSGIGPKSAMGILTAAPTRVLKKAIAGGNAAELHKVYGIGKKVSEKLILELKDSCKAYEESTGIQEEPTNADVLEALVALGYKLDEARVIVHSLPSDLTNVQDKIKEALKRLG